MTREELVKLLKDLKDNPGYYNRDAKVDLLLRYCVEHGKLPKVSIQFVHLIASYDYLLNEYFLEALTMWKKEYNIVELWSIPNLNRRTLLSIY